MSSTYAFGSLLESTSVVSVHAGARLGARGFTRPVSLSVVHPELARERGFSQAFVDAAACFARIADSNLLAVEHVVDERGKLFAVSPALSGTTLARLVDGPACRAKPIAASLVYDVLRAVADAVARVARALDVAALGALSAETVWLTPGGDVLLMPTAVCARQAPARCRKLAVSRYRAPELDRGRPVTPAADVYSLGLLLWDLVSHGRAPAPLDLEAATRAARADIDPGWSSLSMRSLSSSPSDRPASACEFVAELTKAMGPVHRASRRIDRVSDSASTLPLEPKALSADTIEIRTDELQAGFAHDVAKAPVRHFSEVANGVRPEIPRPRPRDERASGAPNAAPSLGPRLVHGDGKRFRLVEERGRWVVGRGSSADLVVTDPDMSREHFEVVRGPGGSFRVTDLKSKNGVFLNGCRARSFELNPGDEVQAGSTSLRFEV